MPLGPPGSAVCSSTLIATGAPFHRRLHRWVRNSNLGYKALEAGGMDALGATRLCRVLQHLDRHGGAVPQAPAHMGSYIKTGSGVLVDQEAGSKPLGAIRLCCALQHLDRHRDLNFKIKLKAISRGRYRSPWDGLTLPCAPAPYLQQGRHSTGPCTHEFEFKLQARNLCKKRC